MVDKPASVEVATEVVKQIFDNVMYNKSKKNFIYFIYLTNVFKCILDGHIEGIHVEEQSTFYCPRPIQHE